jgi:hypothetical protein
MNDFNRLLDEALCNKDIKMLKEIVHFSKGIHCTVFD